MLELPGALQHVLKLLRCSNHDVADNAAATLRGLVLALLAAALREVDAVRAAGQAEAAAGVAAAQADPASNAAPALLQEAAAAAPEAVADADMAGADAAGQEAAAAGVAPGQAASAGQQAAGVAQQAASELAEHFVAALLANQQAGLLQLLQAMHSSSKSVSEMGAVCVAALGTVMSLRLGSQAAFADALLNQQQQQGLSLVLQALHLELIPKQALLAAADVLCILASTAPVLLLEALLSQQHRRGMRSLLCCLDVEPDGPLDPGECCQRSVLLLSEIRAADSAAVGSAGQHSLQLCWS